MEKYQVYHYFSHYESDLSALYWSYAGLFLIFVVSVSIPLYLQYEAVESVNAGGFLNENYVQWHLETEIAKGKLKNRTRKKNNKKGKNEISVDSAEVP